MTEAEWFRLESFAGHWPGLGHILPDSVSRRQAYLAVLAALPRIDHLLPDPRQQALIGFIGRLAEGGHDRAEHELHRQANDAVEVELHERLGDHAWMSTAEGCANFSLHWALRGQPFEIAFTLGWIADALALEPLAGRVWDDAARAERAARYEVASKPLTHILRDVVGNPFRPVAFDPSWRTETVVALARGVYDGRAFGPMPVLADALDDAGCDQPDILAHCRDREAAHVRGCWVVDLVLDKR